MKALSVKNQQLLVEFQKLIKDSLEKNNQIVIHDLYRHFQDQVKIITIVRFAKFAIKTIFFIFDINSTNKGSRLLSITAK